MLWKLTAFVGMFLGITGFLVMLTPRTLVGFILMSLSALTMYVAMKVPND